MFFRKHKVKENIINDIDNDIVNLYISVLENFDELANNIYWIPKSKYLFNEYKKAIHETKTIKVPDSKRAAMYYYVIRNAFNKNPFNVLSTGGGINWKQSLIEELKYSRTKLDGVLIENLDFKEFIDKYKPQPDDLWYLDPPYVVASEKKGYYMHTFNKSDHKEVKNVCDKINSANANFMVSYDDRSEIKDLFSDYNMRIVKTLYGSSSDKSEKEELVITNYECNYGQKSLF